MITAGRPCRCGQAPSEFALNRAGLTPLALAKALRIGSSRTGAGGGTAETTRPLDRRPGLRRSRPHRGETWPWTSELLPEPATPVITVSTPVGMSTSTFAQVVRRGHRGPRLHLRRADGLLHPRAVVQMAPGERAEGSQFPDRALELDLAAVAAGARPQIHDMVGDGDHLRLVLHDEHGVALVAQAGAAARSSAGCRAGAGRSWARRRRR